MLLCSSNFEKKGRAMFITLILYLLYAVIITFIVLFILNIMMQKKVKPEQDKIVRDEYTHVEEDIAPKVTGSGGTYSVILKDVKIDKQIAILNAVRIVTNLSLMDAKILMESAPVVIKENITQEEAQRIKDELEIAGATVELKENN